MRNLVPSASPGCKKRRLTLVVSQNTGDAQLCNIIYTNALEPKEKSNTSEKFSVKLGHRLSTLRQNITSVSMLGHRWLISIAPSHTIKCTYSDTSLIPLSPNLSQKQILAFFSTLYMFLYISPLRFLLSFNCSFTLT